MSATAPRTFAPIVPLLTLLSANAISEIGSLLSSTAIPWFVLQTTNDVVLTGLVGFASLLPFAVTPIFGGILIDRAGFKRTSVTADLVCAAAIAMVPFLHQRGALHFWHLVLLTFVTTLFAIPGDASRRSAVPDLAVLASVRLERATTAVEAVRRLSHMVGPPLAGVLIAAIGTTSVLWLDSASFLTSAILIGLTMPRLQRPPQSEAGLLHTFRAGWTFLLSDRLLSSMVVTHTAVSALLNPLLMLLVPVIAQSSLGESTHLGLMLGAFGGGALTGNLLYGMWGYRFPRRVLYHTSLLLVGLPIWVLALNPGFLWNFISLAVLGVCMGPVGPIVQTTLAERTPADFRGRVFITYSSLTRLAVPLGVLMAGVLTNALGLQSTLIGIATAYLVVSVLTLFLPAFRLMSHPEVTP